MVQRLYSGQDLKFDVSFMQERIEESTNFKIRFFTTTPFFYVEKTKDDINEDYTIDVSWTDLGKIGKGVLQYFAEFANEDGNFPDFEYNDIKGVTTEYYVAFGTTYINDLKSNTEVSEILNEKIEENKRNLEAEVKRATEAEADLQSQLDDYKTSNDEALAAETDRATEAEADLQWQLDEYKESNDEALAAETDRATKAEQDLQNQLDE